MNYRSIITSLIFSSAIIFITNNLRILPTDSTNLITLFVGLLSQLFGFFIAIPAIFISMNDGEKLNKFKKSIAFPNLLREYIGITSIFGILIALNIAYLVFTDLQLIKFYRLEILLFVIILNFVTITIHLFQAINSFLKVITLLDK
jgi:hypothetical protein